MRILTCFIASTREAPTPRRFDVVEQSMDVAPPRGTTCPNSNELQTETRVEEDLLFYSAARLSDIQWASAARVGGSPRESPLAAGALHHSPSSKGLQAARGTRRRDPAPA